MAGKKSTTEQTSTQVQETVLSVSEKPKKTVTVMQDFLMAFGTNQL